MADLGLEHTCEKCGEHFARADSLQRHLRRKTPCDRVVAAETFRCGECGRRFVRKDGLKRHASGRCKAQKARAALGAAAREQDVKDLKARVRLLEKKLGEKALVLHGGRAPAATTINAAVDASVGKTVNNHTININVFGHETTDHIDVDCIREIVETETERLGGIDAAAGPRLAQAVAVAVARRIYAGRPENRTAYLPNVKENRARVRTARGWEERSSAEVARAMHGKAANETHRKQPTASDRDVRLMDPVLLNLGKLKVPMAEMRALLTNLRPGQAAAVAAAAAAAGPGGED
jgi:hypothetical protein